MNPLANWTHAVTEIPDGGLAREKAANAVERDELANALKLISVANLLASYRIDRIAGGAYRLHGQLHAACEQPCVVSLDPVPAEVDETFDIEYWPDHQPDDDAGELPVLGGRDVEPLENGILDVGRIIYETFAAGLNPYPRKPGAEFNWSDDAAQSPEKLSPFAALSKLKDKL